jgi:hypothetical protein
VRWRQFDPWLIRNPAQLATTSARLVITVRVVVMAITVARTMAMSMSAARLDGLHPVELVRPQGVDRFTDGPMIGKIHIHTGCIEPTERPRSDAADDDGVDTHAVEQGERRTATVGVMLMLVGDAVRGAGFSVDDEISRR